MVGGTAIAPKRPNPTEWLTEKQWANMIDLADTVPAFKGLDFDIEINKDKWFVMYSADDPAQSVHWPAEWLKALNSF